MDDNKKINDRFKLLSSKGVAILIKNIRSLSICSKTSNYKYNEDDIDKMTRVKI